MSKMVLTRSTFETLVKHLVDIEEDKNRIIEDYYPNLTKERESFYQLISNYISGIEDYINNVEIQEGEDLNCPFVIIGSTVEVEDLTYNEVEKFQIISPFIDKSNINSDCASYLSPFGSALLLKGVGEKVEIDAPAGKNVYMIKGIELK